MTLIWSGLVNGAIYALVAVGYNVVFISSGTFNFANAQLIMLATFIAYWGLNILHLPAGVTILLCAAVVAAVAGVEGVAIRASRGIEAQLITTVGAATLLNGVSSVIWGGQPLLVPFFQSQNYFTFLGGRVAAVYFWIIGMAIVFTFGIALFMRRTLLGIALLAISEDSEAALLRGINVRKLALGTFAFSGLIAGLTGLFIGAQVDAVATLGTSLAVYGFVAIAIGGFGSLTGGLIGGLAVGLIEALAQRYWGGPYGDVAVFAVLLFVLLVRPAGLFGRVSERMV